MERRLAIVMAISDNVATAIADLKAGQVVIVEQEGRTWRVVLASDIPFGHKFALEAIARGQEVLKYGEAIGRATRDIAPGEQVHTHNLERSLGRAE